jgi:hypothetical protein
MSFFRSSIWVGKWFVGFVSVTGLIGGNAADIPGVTDHPLGNASVTFASKSWAIILHLLWEYPLGVLIGVVAAISAHWMFTHKHRSGLESAYQQRRKAAKSSVRKKSVRVKRKGGGRKNR